MLDSRIIDMTYNKVFLKLVLGDQVPLTLDMLKVCLTNRPISMSLMNTFAVGRRGFGKLVEQAS
jgi:E3 ubiquitin-protein ligase TRIP12